MTDQFLGEIDMDFSRRTFRPCGDPAIATVIATADPDLPVPFMAFLISDPVPFTEYSLHDFDGRGWDCEA